MSQTQYQYSLGRSECNGDDRQYRACSWQDCPIGSADYREMQCALYNNREVLGQMVDDWVPYLDKNVPCQLQCYARDKWFYYNFGKVLDGTRCNPDNIDMCVNGECVHVGCDGILKSDKIEDSCRVCGGDNTSCGHYKNVFKNNMPSSEWFGYNEVAVIPKGSTRIEVIDRSRNYLALMEGSQYIINGNWMINWPGKYLAAGTSIQYQRTLDGFEKIAASGPTDGDLHVMVLFREHNPGIEYEYWLPIHVSNAKAVKTTSYNVTVTQPSIEGGKPFQLPQSDRGGQSLGDLQNRGNEKKSSTDDAKQERKCPRCRKVRGSIKTFFCKSDFASHIQVLSKKLMNDQTRYDVSVIQTYQNQFILTHREYLWVPNTCDCPRLRTGKEYLVTGNLKTNFKDGESRFVITDKNFVRKWKTNAHAKWDTLQQKNPCLP
uniref:ADAMTS-like protein 5-like n=1 Tax=Saccoglossus kowalevskii TaxID=10224 RepID=A0ABM0N1F4_SACKO|nr:PREDICTED: ADAMTS-like protein 5-like [Saccoglossus kowalevskii]